MIDAVINREIANGIWFIANLAYLLFLCQFYLDLRLNSYRYRRLMSKSRIEGITLATMLYFAATSLRSGYIWILLIAENAKLPVEAAIKSWGVVMLIAAAMGITGVLALIKFQSNKLWGAKVWVSIGLITALLPIITHFVINEPSRERWIRVVDWWWYTGNWDPFGII